MYSMFFFVFGLLSINIFGMDIHAPKPKQVYEFAHSTEGNVRFFKPSQTTYKNFEGAPRTALSDYSKALVRGIKLTPEQDAQLSKYQDVIINFMHTICPQIELDGELPSINTYTKASPNTYLYNEKAADHLSAGFVGTTTASVRANLLLQSSEIYYQNLEIQRLQAGKLSSNKVRLSPQGCCVAIDWRSLKVYVGLADGGIGIFDASDPQTFETQPYQKCLKYHTKPVQAIRFFYDNYLFVSKSEDEIIIWHTATQRPLLRLNTLSSWRGHEHLFNGVIVRSHAGPGWNQDLEYAIPYSWTNFDTYHNTEQFAYIFLLWVLHENHEDKKVILRYLLQNCFTVGFDDIIGRALLKNLQQYSQFLENVAGIPPSIRFLSHSQGGCSNSLVYHEGILQKSPDKLTEEFNAALYNFALEKFLDQLPKDLQELYDKNKTAAGLYARKIMPSMLIVQPQQPSSQFMEMHILSDKNKLKQRCLALVCEEQVLLTKHKSNIINVNKQEVVKLENMVVNKMIVNFMPTDDQLSSATIGYGDRKKIDLSWITEAHGGASEIIDLSSNGETIALNAARAIVAVGLDDGGIVLINCLNQTKYLKTEPIHAGPVTGIQFTPNGNYFMSCSQDAAYIWRTGEKVPVLKLEHDNYNYDWHVFDDCIIGANTNFFSGHQIVYDLSERLLNNEKTITIKEMCFFYVLRYIASFNPKIALVPIKILNILYSAIPTTFGPGVYLAIKSFLHNRAQEFNTALTDKRYISPSPRIGLTNNT